MARFYALSIQETVFGQTCLVRRTPGAALPSTRTRQYATCSSCCAPRGCAATGRRPHSTSKCGPARGRAASRSVPVRAGPDQVKPFLAVYFGKRGVDRVGKRWIVHFRREVVAFSVLGRLLQGGAEFNCARVDAEVRTLFGGRIDPLDTRLDVEIKGSCR